MSLTVDILAFDAKTKERFKLVRKAATMQLFENIISDTPVLSGNLQSNWNASENEPDLSYTDLGQKGKTETKTGRGQDSHQDVIIDRMKAIVDKTGDDSAVYLSNPTPYGPIIEYDGHSTQEAPDGMVRINVVKFPQIVETEALKVEALP